MAGRLTDKNTIITGGGAGIGLAIARLFGLEGASVSILDRDEARCKQAEAGLRQEGIDVVAYCVDVADAPVNSDSPADRKLDLGRNAHLDHSLNPSLDLGG